MPICGVKPVTMMGKLSELSYDPRPMVTLKIFLGLLALLAAWAYIFHNKLIFQINAWMRDRIFNDQMVLFSGRRVAMLLFVLGFLALFSGLQSMIKVPVSNSTDIPQLLDQAKAEFRAKKFTQVLVRCREIIKLSPKTAEAWELVVATWVELGDASRAREAAKMLLTVNPHHPIAKSKLMQEAMPTQSPAPSK